jgi:hypothetical protein
MGSSIVNNPGSNLWFKAFISLLELSNLEVEVVDVFSVVIHARQGTKEQPIENLLGIIEVLIRTREARVEWS